MQTCSEFLSRNSWDTMARKVAFHESSRIASNSSVVLAYRKKVCSDDHLTRLSCDKFRKRTTEVRCNTHILLIKTNHAKTLKGHVVSLETFGDPHLAAVLLKKYLRDLPDPLFHEDIYGIIRKCPMPTNDPSDMSSISYIRDTLLPELPHCSYILLNHIFRMSI